MTVTVETTGAFEIPKPLNELSESEIVRKAHIGRVSTEVLRYLTDALTGRGFTWLLPVIFSKSTDPLWPDPGASIEKRVETEIYGETVRTTLSMIIHKLVASSTAYPRFFVLSPNVRIEKRERKATGWHTYEFTQLDFEIRGAGSKDVKRLFEAVIAGLIRHAKKQARRDLTYLGRYGSLKAPVTPFKAHDREDLMAKYGAEWETRLPQEIREPVWVTNIPREFYDFEDPATGRWDNYDLFVPKYGEVLSGARREWEYGRITAKMERDGVKKESYTLLLRMAKEGKLKPSAGAGIGVERLTAWLAGAKHIGEVQAFPKVPGVVYDL
ncbi:MAG: asparagine synthetase [Nitrososphaerota archaeon]|jgi:asparaginyl-tRNA synthetase|nr:asparagine synthetase A [Nitrososphaerota archaeon]MCL5672127.1 asparagine synthetase A [Nitrososphaerota archaeon]MDG6911889.1 asparagine synthetase [Nitrososphaerota archaeon]MDG6924442.1 asparagine synthetase [Nitrososphaerota archaeon]MDG6941106.1 asparagine synthetase [Nitrososphaerota archaeon]